ncbi:unnamed protein product [Lathyrus sativus]|nr:unnamed protein product [Lathyrus sativus]
MSSMVEVWIGELAKLKEKVLINKTKSKEGYEQEKEERWKTQKNTTAISESTICLLMDRFAPC